MRRAGGGSWVCLVSLGFCACSSALPPPAEGDAIVSVGSDNEQICGTVNGVAVPPGTTSMGKTVLDGHDGNGVSCTLKGSKGAYSIDGKISSAAMELHVSGDSSGKAGMSVFIRQGGNTYTDSSCTMTLTQPFTLSAIGIYAEINCPNVTYNPLQPTVTGRGWFVFTGCET